MKRIFADLHLRVNPKDQVATQTMVSKASALGYRLVGVQFSPDTRTDEICRVQNLCKAVGWDFVARVDIRPRSQSDLVGLLRRLRRRFEVVCVQCESKDVARHAAKDRRVDLLNFPHLDYHKRFFDRAEAELASSSLATLEVDVKPLLVLKGPQRVRFLSCLRREVSVALNFHLPVVVSSGVSEPLLMRKPREVALLSSLFGLEGEVALDAISTNALAIVVQNRQKLSSEFVAPGIRLVKQGGDC
jgi:RNase P/RNase MRP subunit p30